MEAKLADFKKLLKAEIEESTIGIKTISKKDIAVIGIALQFPLADSPDEYWQNISQKLDCVREFPKDRKKDVDDYFKFLKSKRIIGTGRDKLNYDEIAFLQEIDKFDYSFFRFSPKEASLMDPNQRIFLETAWHAIEDAGYGGKRIAGSKTGVYVGFSSPGGAAYMRYISDIEPSSAPLAMAGNLPQIISSRISYLLDLRGPALLIDTACSSALVAVHSACQGIRSGDCEMAIAGSIKLNMLPLKNTQNIGISSSDGRTRTFDNKSDGTGAGEGSAAVLLKPLNKALADGDHIYAVIKGSAINQDGNSNGITAPNPKAQERVIISAWENAEVDPCTISYIEAHGTGTKLGDPIEIEGIQQAFRRYTDRKQFCAIGSVKTNLGHLDNAAGIAGLIKAVLTLKYRKLPPSIHFNQPNRKIGFENSPVYVSDRLTEWETGDFPARCGVSSFGLGGTNCHVVLEEAPAIKPEDKYSTRAPYLLALSANSEEGLKRLLKAYKHLAENKPEYDLADICYTANTGRAHLNYRMILLLENEDDFKSKLGMLYDMEPGEVRLPKVHYGKYGSGRKTDAAGNEPADDEKNLLNTELNRKIETYINDKQRTPEILEEICKLYVSGGDADWNKLYKAERRRKVSLPGYPFERRRCWLDVPEQEEEKKLYYCSRWEPSVLKPGDKTADGRRILLLKDACGRGGKLAGLLRENGSEVLEVEFGKDSIASEENLIACSADQQGFEQLMSVVKERKINEIIHMLTLTENGEADNVQELETRMRSGVYSLFFFTRAMHALNINQDLNLFLISRYANEVTGKEKLIHPENASFFGLGKVVAVENARLKCRCVEIDDFTGNDEIVRELAAEENRYQIAYREGKRYTEVFEEVTSAKPAEREIALKNTGVYLVTGGTGGIGLEISRCLASWEKINLALVNRSEFPEREQWDALLEKGADEKLCRKITRLHDIERTGAAVEFYCADISDPDETENLIGRLRSKYGRINGIIHAAGVAGDGFLIRKEPGKFDEVLHPKVYGTWLLDHMTRIDNPDFFILFSSITSMLGGPGQGDYTAANAYLDAYSAYRNKASMKTVTINWSTWKETGMAVDYNVNSDGIFKALSTDTAIEAFEDALRWDIKKLVVGELNMDQISPDSISQLPFCLSENIVSDILRKAKGSTAGRNRASGKQLKPVSLRGKFGEGYTDTEKQIGAIWGEILGFDELDITDNFFEIGGDSILLTGIHAFIEQFYPGKVSMVDLFTYQSINKLAEYIRPEEKILDDTVPVQLEPDNFLEDDILKLIEEAKNGDLDMTQMLDKYIAMGGSN